MTIKQKIKKTIEWTLVTLPLWGGLGILFASPIIENHKYNSLSIPEKIQYIENKLNSSSYQNPPAIAFCPKGAATLAIWGEQKRYIQEELNKLKEK